MLGVKWGMGAAVLAALGFAVACGMEEGGPMADAEIEGRCPAGLVVGVPAVLTSEVTNESDEDWPVLNLSFSSGLDAFTVEGAQLAGGGSAVRADTPSFDTFAFRQGVSAGETRRISVGVIPIDAGNIDLRFTAWGSETHDEDRLLPSDATFVECSDLPIRP